MTKQTTIKELRNMPLSDLHKEIRQKQQGLAKMRMAVKMGSEKDSAKYQKAKKELARMNTVVTEKNAEASKKIDQPTPASKS